ncbi:MAG TPA: efflux RND transporter permease subunit, partial [Vampirovibrionales bacterium]
RSQKNSTGTATAELPNSPRRKITPYRTALTWALKHRGMTLVIAFAFFIGSLQLVPYIPTGLFNSGDTGLSTVNIELPPGSTLVETDRTAQRTIALLKQHPAVGSVLATVGSGGASRELNTATLYVNLLPKKEREVSQQVFEQQMREEFIKIPGARISFQSAGAGGSSKALSIVLKSENPTALQEAADTLERQMRELPGLVEVSSSASVVKPEILIKPDPQRAADLGVSVQAIARTASLATLGDNEANLAKFELSDRQIPIRVWLSESYRNDLKAIGNLEIPSQSGDLVPLSAVANIVLGSGPAQIDRYDRARQVSIEANLQGVSLGDALAQVEALPGMTLPPGVEKQSSGDAKIMQEIFGRFLGALGLAVLSIFAILVL